MDEQDNINQPPIDEYNIEPDTNQIPINPTPHYISTRKEKKQKTSIFKVIWGIFSILSILANFIFILLIAGLVMISFGEGGDMLIEKTLVSGSQDVKIAILNIEGIIDSQTSDDFKKQIRTALSDSNVMGIIVRTNTPGGSVSASDQIHHMITQYKNQTHKPVIAFMQGMATSGGYYTSVACDQIMAEPTTITGSIGVIMNHFEVAELFEDKLGIKAVTIKSGQKKDWPSSFNATTDEQKKYLMDTLINPAYERFVKLVDEGRSNLKMEQILALADGSIYGAPMAMEVGLIDQQGYIEDAINMVSELARISNPTVIQYNQPFSMGSLLTSKTQSIFNITTDIIHKVSTPELMYLWK